MRIAVCDDETMWIEQTRRHLWHSWHISLLLEVGKNQEEKSQKDFFLWIANLFDDHPVSCKRMVALEEGRGKLF